MSLDFGAVLGVWPALARGAGTTLLLTGCVLAVATPAGMAVAAGRRSGAWVGVPLAVLGWVVRGIPPILILLMVFFVPAEFGVTLPPFVSAVTGLSIYMAFTYAEVFRAGLLSIDRGQHQAADALGLPPWRVFRRIVLPQMMAAIVPPYFSHTSSLLKNTALAAVVAIRELTAVGKSLLAVTYRPLETLFVVAVVYAAFSAVLFLLQSGFERRFVRS